MPAKTKPAPKPKATTKPSKARKPAPIPAEPVVVEPAPAAPAKPAPTHEQIAAKAYEIWVAKGRPIGQDDLNWIEAELALTR